MEVARVGAPRHAAMQLQCMKLKSATDFILPGRSHLHTRRFLDGNFSEGIWMSMDYALAISNPNLNQLNQVIQFINPQFDPSFPLVFFEWFAH